MADKLDRKETILKVAQRLFARFGLAKTTIEDIARQARMGKASIYYYFKSKESIFREVIEKEGAEVRRKLQEAVARAASPQEKLRAYALARMQALKELANYYNAMADEYLEHYAFIEKARKSFDAFELDLISKILQEGVQKGIFSIARVPLTAEAILAAIKGLEYRWTIEVPLDTIRENIDVLLDILFRGIEKRN